MLDMIEWECESIRFGPEETKADRYITLASTSKESLHLSKLSELLSSFQNAVREGRATHHPGASRDLKHLRAHAPSAPSQHVNSAPCCMSHLPPRRGVSRKNGLLADFETNQGVSHRILDVSRLPTPARYARIIHPSSPFGGSASRKRIHQARLTGEAWSATRALKPMG